MGGSARAHLHPPPQLGKAAQTSRPGGRGPHRPWGIGASWGPPGVLPRALLIRGEPAGWGRHCSKPPEETTRLEAQSSGWEAGAQGPVLLLGGTSPRASRELWGPRALPLPASQLLWVCVLGTPVTVDSTLLSGQEAVPITLRRALPTPTAVSSQGPASCLGTMSTGRPRWSHLLRAAPINRINLP